MTSPFSAFCNASDKSPADIDEFLKEPPTETEGKWKRELREAGGNGRGTTSDGARVRVNPITNQLFGKACLTCGLVGDPKPCAGCRSALYCSKECQASDWKRHKKACKATQKAISDGLAPTQAFSGSKWLNAYPNTIEMLRKAFDFPDVILPLVVIKIGSNDARSAWHYPRLKTQTDIDYIKTLVPESFNDMFRIEDESVLESTHLPRGTRVEHLRRVVIVLFHSKGVQVMRVRVGTGSRKDFLG